MAALLQAEADRRVTVAWFDQPHEAHLARLRLEAEGIDCALEGEHAGGLACPPAASVRLRVRAWQEPAARTVLSACEPRPSSADWVTGELDAARCPRCGSLRVAEPLRPRRGPRWRWLELSLPFARSHARCRHCAHRWVLR
jgi:DNA-directed RNA polymerase subunit RPC12/RpoP